MHKGRVIYLTDYEESFPIAGERARLETDKFRRFRPTGSAERSVDDATSRGFLSSLDCRCDLFSCLHVTDLSVCLENTGEGRLKPEIRTILRCGLGLG